MANVGNFGLYNSAINACYWLIRNQFHTQNWCQLRTTVEGSLKGILGISRKMLKAGVSLWKYREVKNVPRTRQKSPTAAVSNFKAFPLKLPPQTSRIHPCLSDFLHLSLSVCLSLSLLLSITLPVSLYLHILCLLWKNLTEPSAPAPC